MQCLRAAVIGFAGAMTTAMVQSGTLASIAGTAWLTAVLVAAVAAVNQGHMAWPETPAPAPQPQPMPVPPPAWPPPIPPSPPPVTPPQGGGYEA